MIRRSLAARMGMAIIVLILSVVSVLYVIIGQLFEDAFQANSEQQLQTQITQYTNMARPTMAISSSPCTGTCVW